MQSLSTQFHAFAKSHDDLPLFHAGYLVLTLLAFFLLNLGVFSLLIAAHIALDLVKFSNMPETTPKVTVIATVRENLIDLFMLSLALCLAVYLHHGAGIIAVSALLRLEVTLVRSFAIFLPQIENVWHGMSAFGNIRRHVARIQYATAPWSMGEKVMLWGFLMSLFLIVIAPVLTHDFPAVALILKEELMPWGR